MNGPKMTLNTTRSKVPHTCHTQSGVPESQMLISFALRHLGDEVLEHAKFSHASNHGTFHGHKYLVYTGYIW